MSYRCIHKTDDLSKKNFFLHSYGRDTNQLANWKKMPCESKKGKKKKKSCNCVIIGPNLK